MRRTLIAAAVLAMFVIGCSDGKFNLLLVLWNDADEVSSSSEEIEPQSSSSLSYSQPSLSSSLPLSSFSSSSLGFSSSSEEVSSSNSGRGPRSSSSKSEVDFPPPLEEGASDVIKGWASRYWDGCKPHCSWPVSVASSEPWAICRNCDRDNYEMPAYFMHPDSSQYYDGEYLGTPNACDDGLNLGHEALWKKSPAYTEWQNINPAYPNSSAYACWDMTPHVVNDTLAYAFAATPKDGVNRCGKCYQLQFDGDDHKNPGKGRDTHRALRGKIMIVLSSNVGGLEPNQFDIMIPGGGLGDFDAFTGQIGVSKEDLGPEFGGLLTVCISEFDYYKDATRELLQDCVKRECHKIFGSNDRAKNFLDGCLFMADWYMAADNPSLYYKEVKCPKYLADKYKSTIHTEKPPHPYPQ